MEFTTRFRLHSQATRLLEALPYAADSRLRTGLSPSLTLLSSRIRPGPHAGEGSLDHNSISKIEKDSRLELLPLHSLLLRQSCLVSFPPLNYMLKFSGYSHLISDRKYGVDLLTQDIEKISRTKNRKGIELHYQVEFID